MFVRDLPESTRHRIAKLRYDSSLEKHEGPWDWDWALEYSEFLDVDGRPVLLPIDQESHAKIHVLRTVLSSDQSTLVVYLQDKTYDENDMLSGRVAICERFPGEQFYLGMFYHEWFTIPSLRAQLGEE